MIFSVAATSDRSLLTVAEARAAIGDDSVDVTALIARVSAAIVAACNVPQAGATPATLRQETVTAIFRLKSRQNALIMPRRPIVSITSIVENDVTLTADDYEVDAAAGLIKRLSGDCEICWPCGKIAVVAPCGWATVPEALKRAAAKQLRNDWFEAQRVTGLRSMEIPGVISESYQDKDVDNPNVTNEVMQALQEGGFVNYAVG